MRLTSQPKDTVIFTVMPDDPTEGTTSPNIIAFSDTTWMLPQSIDIVGIDDPDLDMDQYYNVNVKTMYTNDPDYSHPTTGLLSATREFVNLDDATDKALTACPMGMYGTIESGGVPNCFACPQGTYSDTTKNVTVVGKCKSCPCFLSQTARTTRKIKTTLSKSSALSLSAINEDEQTAHVPERYMGLLPDFSEQFEATYKALGGQGSLSEGEGTGDITWFNAGLRIGVGVGLGICLGAGLGAGIIMRSYQAASGGIKRRFSTL